MAQLSPGDEQVFRIDVVNRPAEVESVGQSLVRAARLLGLTALESCAVSRLFFLQGHLSPAEVERLARELLADPVTEQFTVTPLADAFRPAKKGQPFIEVTPLPGVTDPAAENLLKAAHRLGMTGLKQAATGKRYRLTGKLGQADLRRLATEVLSNPVVQQAAVNAPIAPPFFSRLEPDDTVEIIPLLEADDARLPAISAERRLALNLAEMRAVRAYFRRENREPTEVELEMLAQTWSEHCVHKTFRATIRYTGPRPGQSPDAPLTEQTINGLLKTYIRAATDALNKPWIRSAFVDNAGIIAFDDQWDLAFKLETHNHPSALEPFGGANTGVGGVVRDVIGVSARPIANTDVLCFGPPNLPVDQLPAGVLHPRRIADGVIHGVEDYGNKMGIPTVNGAILYHAGYTANPLVFCGCLGILPHNSHPTQAHPGDLIVVIGGRTGRDGLRGATFSSMEMDQTTGQIAGSAVQIGHPIHEKQALEVTLRARDEKLYTAITDCGAGGLSSAVGEMAKDLGAEVQLQTVPLKYAGLRPWEIWLSEAQERMVFAVPPQNLTRMQEICAGQDVTAVVIGTFEATGRIRLRYGERLVGDLDVDFLHNGIPLGHLEAEWKPGAISRQPSAVSGETPDAAETLLKLLAHPNIRSKESTVRRYDHEVQAGAAVKPFVGVDNQGPGDATVLVPFDVQGQPAGNGRRGAALSNGVCPEYTDFDPYAMAWAAVDEAVRNAVAVGADPDQVAILDNFCWGNPNLPDRLGSLVRCAQGCYDAALAYGAPFISGKDSFNNEYTGVDGRKHAIPGTLLISALAIVPDVNKTATMDLKTPGNLLYIIGETGNALLGSHYALVNGVLPAANAVVPPPIADPLIRYRAVHRAIAAGLVQACHDCSEGGLAVALAEMCLAGRLGAVVELAALPGAAGLPDDAALFAESAGRLVLEVRPPDAEAFESLLAGVPHARIGHVRLATELVVRGQTGAKILSVDAVTLEKAWRERRNEEVKIKDEKWVGEPKELEKGYSPFAIGHLPFEKRILVLHANGTNRDRDAALACQLAGGQPEIVHINQLIAGERNLPDYAMWVVPGGFSYGDDLGAGTLWAFDLRHRLGEAVQRFVESGRPVLGICNGFQVLVKSGLLPGFSGADAATRTVTLAPNASARFECRWVYLQPNPASPSLFTAGLTDPIYCPVAHGEGRVAVADELTLAAIQSANLNALTYVNAAGSVGEYPANPNGSVLGIAGLCNPAGNVLGLMPHPEDHIFPWQHPRRHRGESGFDGLRLFKNGVKNA